MAVHMEGVVLKSTGSWYVVMDHTGQRYDCRLRGRFKVSGSKSTNPVAVGDFVDIVVEHADQGTAIIERIHDRKNYLIRKATNLSRQVHVIAANLDQVVIIASLAEPRTSTGFIDRMLVSCEAYSIPATIVFNKTDLIQNPQGQEHLQGYLDTYTMAGYSCLTTSVVHKFHLEAFAHVLQGKTSLLSGHSGVGKSSLINAIEPGVQLKVQEISTAHLKGKHTTTFAEMIALTGGGYIIDTPGIKEFGLVDFQPEELSHFFPEMRKLFNMCRFDNCTHMNEPGCAVKEYVEQGKISMSRYANYVNMLLGTDTRG